MKWLVLAVVVACSRAPVAPMEVAAPAIDRFAARAAHLMVRSAANHLPRAGEPIDLDQPPFITQSYGPGGAVVRYYNFDIQSDRPATLWRLTRAGERVALQPDIVDRIPGDDGYTDFWRVAWVEVPATFVPGSITSAQEIREHGFPIAADSQILDCPILPRGSTAREGHSVPTELWYRGARVWCLGFGEPLHDQDGRVPTSPIYVTFARNPGTEGGGPPSGFRKETRAPRQTHNVVLSVPGDIDYSPLWDVHIYDRAAFDQVHDAATAQAAPLVEHGPLVNCPVVYVAP